MKNELTKEQAKNALARIKDALRGKNEEKAIELVKQIYKAGYNNAINNLFNSEL